MTTSTAPRMYAQVRWFAATVMVACSPASLDLQDASQPTSACVLTSIAGVTASGNDGNMPANVLDGDFGTRWSSFGIGQFITSDLGSAKAVCAVQVAWYDGNLRQNSFTVSLSSDGSTFTQVFSGRSSGTTTALETYDVPDRSARYVRVTVLGNTLNQWASITELRASTSDGGAGGNGTYSLFATRTPANQAAFDTGGVELGLKFRSTEPGTVSAIRFFRGVSNSAGYTVKLYTDTGIELARATGPGSATPGWQEIPFPAPVSISANTLYVASYYTSNGRYAVTYEGLSTAASNGPLTAPASGSVGGNCVYRYGGGFPVSSYRASNYFVDVTFTRSSVATSGGTTGTTTADRTAPSVVINSPASGTTVSGTVTVTGTSADDVSVAKVELQVDGGTFSAATGTSSWAYSLNTTALSGGTHTLTARATDTSGNTNSGSVTVTVMNPEAPPPSTCSRSATPSTFATALAAAAGGESICLAMGNYNVGRLNIAKPSVVTIRPADGVARSSVVISNLALDTGAQNLTFSNLTIAGAEIPYGADPTNTDIINCRFTGLFKIDARYLSNTNIDLVGNTHDALNTTAYSDGRIHIAERNDAALAGIRIADSHFGSGGGADGILSGGNGVTIERNTFEGFTQDPSGVDHTDPIQLWGAKNHIVRGNLFRNNTVASAIMIPDGDVTLSLFEDNVIDMSASGDCRTFNFGGTMNNTIQHNTLIGCFHNRASNQGIPSSNNVFKNNIVTQGINTYEGASFSERSYNLVGSGATGQNEILGRPLFVGGAQPTTYAGYKLLPESLGYRSASDGADRGARIP